MQTLLIIATLVSSIFDIHKQVPAPSIDLNKVVEQKISQYLSQDAKLGAAPSPIAGSTYSLSGSGVSSSATSVTLQSLTITQTGQKILTGDLAQGAGDRFYVTIDPGNRTRQEIVGCTTVTQNSAGTATLSSCSRGMSPVYPYAASTTLAFVHAGGASVIFGDAPQLFNNIINYVASTSYAGTVDSSLTLKGVVERATGAEAGSTTQTGSGNTSAPLALTTDISTSTCQLSGNYVLVTDNNGKLNDGCINTTITNKTLASTTLTSTTTFSSPQKVIDSSNFGLFNSQLLASTSIAVAAGSISATSLPFRTHLHFVFQSPFVTSGANTKFTLNGDTGNDYSYLMSSTSCAGSGIAQNTQANFQLGNGNTQFITVIGDIIQIATTTRVISGSSMTGASAGANISSCQFNGVWVATTSASASVNQITFTPTAGSYAASTTLYVFGSSF